MLCAAKKECFSLEKAFLSMRAEYQAGQPASPVNGRCSTDTPPFPRFIGLKKC